MNFKYLIIILLIILLVLISFLIPQFCIKNKIILGGLWNHDKNKDEVLDLILKPILIAKNDDNAYYFEELKELVLKKIKRIKRDSNISIANIFMLCYDEIKSKLDDYNSALQVSRTNTPNFGLFLLILGMIINKYKQKSIDFLSLHKIPISESEEEMLNPEEILKIKNFIDFRNLLADKYIEIINKFTEDMLNNSTEINHEIHKYYVDAILDEEIDSLSDESIDDAYYEMIKTLKLNVKTKKTASGYSSDDDVFPVEGDDVFPVEGDDVFPVERDAMIIERDAMTIERDAMTMSQFCSILKISFVEYDIIDKYPCKSNFFLEFIDLYIPNFRLKTKQIFDKLIFNNELKYSTIQQFLPPYLIGNNFLMSYIFIKYICILFLEKYRFITTKTFVSFDMGSIIIDKGETILLNIIYLDTHVFICMIIMTTNMPTILSTIYHSFWNKPVFKLKIIECKEVESLHSSTLEDRLAKYHRLSSLETKQENIHILDIFDENDHVSALPDWS
jgi:hypothetical protein